MTKITQLHVARTLPAPARPAVQAIESLSLGIPVTLGVLALVALAWDGLKDIVIGDFGLPMLRADVLSGFALLVLMACVLAIGLRLIRRARADRLTRAEHRLLEEIDAGLRNGEFVPYFQPIYDLHEERVVAAEALVRWVDATGRVRPPADFIPLLEKTNRLTVLTRAMFDQVARSVADFDRAGLSIDVSVNISAQDFENIDVASEIETYCLIAGIAPNRVKVELTETHSLQRVDMARIAAAKLSARSIQLVLDDFGTGYASMHVLDLLPFSQIKLDRSFIAGLLTDPTARAIVKASRSLAFSLGLEVVAEGVEDAATVERLADMGIRLIQGYYYGRAMPAGEFLAAAAPYRVQLAA
ncbi:EAL domain-containing protein [Ferrovibrio xuzhouensis]|uniref:EAL domain-containing protein n=1 Tax=Ferrovibrio xuzhouensis TaxID=1576914 RepID=A0ABV7VFP7_9PROT